jgi:CheY-like chemotaxis protein
MSKNPNESQDPALSIDIEQARLFAEEIAKARSGDLSRRMSRGRGPLKLLMADDEVQLRILVATTLSGDGYELIEAADGEEALAAIREHHPQVALLDVNMPGMSGIELCKQIKADEELSHTRVVMLTGAASLMDRDEALAAGADLYLTKPFRPRELLQAIDHVMRLA